LSFIEAPGSFLLTILHFLSGFCLETEIGFLSMKKVNGLTAKDKPMLLFMSLF